MKRIMLILLALVWLGACFAEELDDLIFKIQDDSLREEIIKVNFAKKDARRAMLYSALLPGAGQFYADKSAFTTYLFPVLELGMIGGIIYFNHRGNEKTEEFEYYANGEDITQTFDYTVDGVNYSYTYAGKRYRRDYQLLTQNVLININEFDIYDGSFFRLDPTDSQHFYEDIGKYNKYIFGWADWFHRFATDPTSPAGDFILDNPDYEYVWVFSGSTDPQLVHRRRWEQNYLIEDYMNGVITNPIDPSRSIASPLRQKYIELRKAANAEYNKSRLFILGLALNHITSAIDAAVLTSQVNRSSLTRNDLKFYYCADLSNNRLTPLVGLSYRF